MKHEQLIKLTFKKLCIRTTRKLKNFPQNKNFYQTQNNNGQNNSLSYVHF